MAHPSERTAGPDLIKSHLLAYAPVDLGNLDTWRHEPDPSGQDTYFKNVGEVRGSADFATIVVDTLRQELRRVDVHQFPVDDQPPELVARIPQGYGAVVMQRETVATIHLGGNLKPTEYSQAVTYKVSPTGQRREPLYFEYDFTVTPKEPGLFDHTTIAAVTVKVPKESRFGITRLAKSQHTVEYRQGRITVGGHALEIARLHPESIRLDGVVSTLQDMLYLAEPLKARSTENIGTTLLYQVTDQMRYSKGREPFVTEDSIL